MALVFIVDDDKAVRDALGFVLSVEGFGVRLFPSAAEVLGQEAWRDAGCLLVDYFMPGMTGIELVGALRQRGCRVPAFLMTTRADRDLKRRARHVGIGFILEKPLSDSALIELIHAALAGGGNL